MCRKPCVCGYVDDISDVPDSSVEAIGVKQFSRFIDFDASASILGETPAAAGPSVRRGR
jgi:hypothetical protein